MWRGNRLPLIAVLVGAIVTTRAGAHDIPNARVDRATQVTVTPGRLRVDYEVSLTELTLTQELRSLIGHLPGGGRSDWFSAYGRETGPLNAKGFLIASDAEDLPLKVSGFDLVIEEHPRYTFHFETELPASGHVTINDTNFATSEGTCRLAVRGEGVGIRGDELPSDVAEIPARPVWQLSDKEEARTHRVVFDFAGDVGRPEEWVHSPASSRAARPAQSRPSPGGLSALLDRTSGLSLGVLALLAFALGAVHALQPGHGKTMVVATVLGDRGGWPRAVGLAAVTTMTHTGSVILVALALWWTSTLRFGEVHVALTRTAGYLMAAVGCWRVGRHLGGFLEHDVDHPGDAPGRGLVALGIAGGIVPCWDAVGLVVLAEAVGRLGLALGLVVAFSLGLGLVLASFGWFAERFRRILTAGGAGGPWPGRLGLISGLALSALGVYLFTWPTR